MYLKIPLYFLSLVFFSYLEINIPRIYSVQTVPIIHHVITSSVSNYLLYNDTDLMLNMFNTPKEEISPLLSYFPIFSCAFGLYDLYNAIFIQKKMDFILHGVLFYTVGVIFMHNENFHWLYPGLLMETSSVFLNLTVLPYDFIKYSFAATFLFYRNIVFPYISIIFIKDKYVLFIEPKHYNEKIILFSLFCINYLNFFWGYKIVKKLIRHIKNE